METVSDALNGEHSASHGPAYACNGDGSSQPVDEDLPCGSNNNSTPSKAMPKDAIVSHLYKTVFGNTPDDNSITNDVPPLEKVGADTQSFAISSSSSSSPLPVTTDVKPSLQSNTTSTVPEGGERPPRSTDLPMRVEPQQQEELAQEEKCGECGQVFTDMQSYWSHDCSRQQPRSVTSSEFSQEDQEDMEEDGVLTDVESFDGKIVYNPDGSAYIIEGESDLSETESILDLPKLEGSIVDQRGKLSTSQSPAFPLVANAFYIQRNPNPYYNTFYMFPPDNRPRTEAPIMHSYKVYDLRVSKNKENKESSLPKFTPKLPTSVPTKPILMCFICKLSFGYAKSFVAHASGEHQMTLNKEEKEAIGRKNASAIIQGVGKDKEPLMSFLEPTVLPKTSGSGSSAGANAKSVYQSDNSTNVSFVYSGSKVTAMEQGSSSSDSNSSLAEGSSQQPLPFAQADHKDGARGSASTSPPRILTPNDNQSSRSQSPRSLFQSEQHCEANGLPGSERTKSKVKAEPSWPQHGSPRASLSDVSAASSSSPIMPSTLSGMPSLPTTSHGIVIRSGCDEHPQGNITGVECPKCDAVLGSSRSLGGHMTMMHSRNSCKTLKCPKCNWHYKYQETLEIHMKEKHPDTETQCVYCITNQTHPRLARGEVYTCGYKPYRCEVCNYSTTTKGNLSIHMQSDKHINNMQELHNGSGEHLQLGTAPPQPPTPSQGPPAPSPAQPSTPVGPPASTSMLPNVKKEAKPKPTWRCDVCNYETNVARNLRIHMTSEKHTHNMMVLQQNVKHMQRDMQFQLNQMALMGQDPTLMAMSGGMPGMPPLSFDQAMFMTPLPGTMEIPMDLTKQEANGPKSCLPMDIKNNNNEASQIFQCFVCNVFSTDSLEKLHQHMQVDRSKQNDHDTVTVIGGTYMCNLCTYKTNLKANFQLHCKTDKHLQKLMLVNHIREGGPANEWRLKYMNVSNPVQVRCNACDYYTNSIHKLQLHSSNIRHDANAKLFQHLLAEELRLGEGKPKYYHCTLCNYNSKARLNLIQHVRSMRHIRAESHKLMQLTEQGKDAMAANASFAWTALFHVKEFQEADGIKFDENDADGDTSVDGEDGMAESLSASKSESSDKGCFMCPFCNYSCASELQLQGHLATVHSQSSPPKLPVPQPNHASKSSSSSQPSDIGSSVACPLCGDKSANPAQMESHLVQSHNVKAEVLRHLMLLVNPATAPSPPTSSSSPSRSTPSKEERALEESMESEDDAAESSNETETLESRALRLAEEASMDGIVLSDKEGDDQFRCQTCSKTFQNIDELYSHQNELGHLELKQTPRGPGYLCWKRGCNQYFKTAQTLQVHFREIHARPQVSVSERHAYKYRCHQCSLAFKTLDKLQLHSYYHIIRAATECSKCDKSFRTTSALHRHMESTHFESMTEAEKEDFKASMAATAQLTQLADKSSTKEEPSEESKEMEEDEEDSRSSGYKEEQFMEDYINSQAIAENSYHDPSRKYKCHRCKVAFTKQNYLSAHNKTLMHRKGDKVVNFERERYLDPNRPYKCDICKESFTQKNILLFHYNSVSHLHKKNQLKAAQEEGAESNPSPAPSPEKTPPRGVPSPQEPPAATSTPNPAPPATSAPQDKKPYKCNICKVSYSQSSTLDIHIRSVLHQTRASKIQELAMTGQVDLNQPLIEQPPEASRTQEQHKRALAEMLQHKQLQQQHPGSEGESNDCPTPSETPTPIVIKPIDGDLPDFACQKCGSVFENQEMLVNHLQNHCYMQPGPGALRGMPRFRPAVQRNLLENIGFECVMQFNEYHQFKQRDDKNNNQKREAEQEEKGERKEEMENEAVAERTKKVEEVKKEVMDMPEMNKCPCRMCGKEFSSIWVLKTHEEDVHKQIMPIEMVEEFSGKYREDYNKRVQPAPEAMPSVECSTPVSSASLRTETPSIKAEIPSGSSGKASADDKPTGLTLSTDLAAAQAAQMMQLPMFNMMGMGMHMGPMGMVPPLMPMMMPMESFGLPGLPPMMDPGAILAQQQQQQQAAAAAYASAQQQKRARTRISDEQLKILRAHFDIINSPTEEQIMEMSEKSGLPPKVIKHWFRNTLFKERQRNKDSPYNFNVPPTTQLNLEEYEKTGKVPVASTEEKKSESRKEVEQELPQQDFQDTESVTSVTDSFNSSAPSTPVPPPPTSIQMQMHQNMMSQAAVSYAELSAALSTMNHSLTSPVPPPMPLNNRTPTGPSPRTNPNPSPSTPLMGKRANRTRFTDYQIKVLQEYFEQNAYPKDDDLENLSKMLNLSPRVIVVWFQNARQKARKNYENQPAGESLEDSSKFTRTPGLNYQCKKCFTVFQRYYELIKHQRTHCFKDLDKDQSRGEDSNSSDTHLSVESSPRNPKPLSASSNMEYKCDKCTATFSRYDLWKEHQSLHQSPAKMMSPFAPSSAFGMLQNIAKQQRSPEQRSPQIFVKQEEPDISPLKRRPLEDDEDDRDDQPRDKRMRTTILPEQLDYLYQKYQVDCNPSRKQLENIAHEVGLKKRVVQVWFQNTRARERKGQYRAHQQIIHKRCPFCRALFRAKSALESHLATKHAAEMARGEVNIDNIPDEEVESNAETTRSESGSPTPSTAAPPPALDMAKLLNNPYNVPNPFMPLVPPGLPGAHTDPLQTNMKRLYEDSLKKYLDELSHASHQQKREGAGPPKTTPKSEADDTPLDLSKPLNMKLKVEDDTKSETHSESTNEDASIAGESNPSSPSSRAAFPNKRYRTQMSSLQIHCMKHIFTDYKTPTMTECELLGREIGLPKRVVQVWFQNARAKEKKSKLAYSSTFGTEPDTNRPPEECTLCGFKYSHKYTIQDHVFTRRHIDRVKSYVSKQGDEEDSNPSKSWSSGQADPSLVTHPHLAQLHAMGLQAMNTPSSSAQSGHTESRNQSSSDNKNNASGSKSKSESSEFSVSEPSKHCSEPSIIPTSVASQMLNPFGVGFPMGGPPGHLDLGAGGILPFMYPGGLGGLYPGMPMVPPGLLPGPESMFMYDAASFCTPLSMLQIPKAAIAHITSQVQEGSVSVTHYTQDCSTLAELHKALDETNAKFVRQTTLDVGFICSKCHMVFPAQDACMAHQQMVCFQGKTPAELHKSMVKLEQWQYECRVCGSVCNTAEEFRAHCQQEAHRSKLRTHSPKAAPSVSPRMASRENAEKPSA